jgi:hypothetical protein
MGSRLLEVVSGSYVAGRLYRKNARRLCWGDRNFQRVDKSAWKWSPRGGVFIKDLDPPTKTMTINVPDGVVTRICLSRRALHSVSPSWSRSLPL